MLYMLSGNWKLWETVLARFVSIYMHAVVTTFLGYLTKWRASVTSRVGFIPADKALMLLSRETEGGLLFVKKWFVHYRYVCV